MDEIKIAFCFDTNFYYPAMVAIASFLENTKNDVTIYCVVNDDITNKMQKKFVNFLHCIKHNSQIFFFINRKNF